MKKYIKNKDFIPERFYRIKQLNINKSEKRIISLFIILNLLLLPFTARIMLGSKEKTIKNLDNIVHSKHDSLDINDIDLWIENIFNDDIKEACITNNNGELVVSDFNKVNELARNNRIKINDINLNENNKYKLGVSLNE
ncbi:MULTISPECIES: hypothetical protein [unclassified Clostridium]|uniref:hypothetical protein n=1 Tax=unclassified Clostridium TaxID=2614128 RepID=UPI0002972BB9|nr:MULTISPECIES: hypothetical protein [unclassified Clostridium]EKQ58199.1 MAG: hypothetical protein A370_00054 [Clostridium sp. Maddingley MBC34-26]